MNANERYRAVLKNKSFDRIPCICPGGMMNMITRELQELSGIKWPDAHTNPEMMAKLAIASYKNSCFDNIGVPFCMTVEAETLGAEVTLGTDVFEPHVTGYRIETASDWKTLNKIDLSSGRSKVVIDAIKIIKAQNPDAPIIGNVTGPISIASSVMEPVNFYKELRRKPEACHEYLEFVTKEATAFARAQIESGADVIAISEPSGTGEILGPRLFEEYAVKYINMILDGIADTGVSTIVHICGNMRNVYKQFDMVKSDVLSFDSTVGMHDARRNLSNRLLMGSVSTYALEFSDVAGISRLTKSSVNGGADIIAPACGIGVKSPLANIQAMIKTLEEELEKSDA